MNSSIRAPEEGSLHAATLEHDYFSRVGEVIREMQQANDQAQAVDLLHDAARRMGAEVAIFASFIRDDDSYRSYRLLLACDPRWFAEYERQGRYDDDPWLAYALKYVIPVRSSQIPVTTDSERAAVELAAKYGFRSAVIVPTPSSGKLSRTGVLCLGSSKPGFFDDEGFVALRMVARAVAMELHDWWIGRMGAELVARAELSEEDLVLLAHERRGLSSKLMARALKVSVSSIDSRFYRMLPRLGVANRRAAARLAAEYGLV